SGVTPVPVSVADTDGVGGCSVALVPPMVTVADADPDAVGENATLTVHDAPTASVVPQLGALPGKPPLVTRVKGAAPPVMVMPLRGELPVFLTVRFCVALVVPAVSLPNASKFGVTLAVYVG